MKPGRMGAWHDRKGATPVKDTKVNLNTEELSARWDTTPQRLATWRWQGKGPSYWRCGTRVLYPLRAIEEYEQAHLVHAVSAS